MSLLLLWVETAVYARALPGVTVSGRVFLPDNQPAVEVTVNITGQNGFNASAKTDARGGYRFEGIPPTLYNLSVVPPDNTRWYADRVSVDTTRDGPLFTADIFLRSPVEAPPARSSSSPVISAREAAQHIPSDARKAYGKAQRYREQRKLDAALAELDKAISVYPDYFQALAERGIVQINAGHLDEALRDFNKALEIVPEYEPALSGAGYCLLTMGEYRQSIAFLEKAVRLGPIQAKNLLFLGIANLAVKQWEKAQEALERALKVDPAGSVLAHMYLADALAGQHLYRRAADEVHIYLEKNPAAPNADRLRQREEYLRSQQSQER
jgi:tetratricopeptide (TPR) repeat protein